MKIDCRSCNGGSDARDGDGAGRAAGRLGGLIVFGMLGMAAVSAPLAFVGVHTGLWPIRAIKFARGIGMAFAFVPLQAATYANITPGDTGRASAIFSTQRQVATVLVALAAASGLLIRDEDAASS